MGPAIRPRSPTNTNERAEPSAVTSEEQFLAHLPLLDRVIAFVAHRYGLARPNARSSPLTSA